MHNEIIYSKLKSQLVTHFSLCNLLILMSTSGENQNARNFNKMEQKVPNTQVEMSTAVKKVENNFMIYTQITPPRPNKKILLYDQDSRKHLFPLIKDREAGIGTQYQNIVHKSYNDDDKQTSSTQLHRGMMQTIEDMYEIVEEHKQHQYDDVQ